MMTNDGGRHWTDAIPYDAAKFGSAGPVTFADPIAGWFAVGGDVRLFHTTDGGHTWAVTAIP
jgi:photosystem II stability/assembly factor-like uncharacterized protein